MSRSLIFLVAVSCEDDDASVCDGALTCSSSMISSMTAIVCDVWFFSLSCFVSFSAE